MLINWVKCELRTILVASACLVPLLCVGQPADCAKFLGRWSGTWSQGQYGTQRIHVTHVTDQCVATLAYSPTEAMPQGGRLLPIVGGVIAFGCNVPGGTCRLEVKNAELLFTYTDPSGFVNNGTFRQDR
jgi:hypothetical protein